MLPSILPDENRREHSENCNINIKTSNERATAEEDDERRQPLRPKWPIREHSEISSSPAKPTKLHNVSLLRTTTSAANTSSTEEADKRGNTARNTSLPAKPTNKTLNKTYSSTLCLETEAGKVQTNVEVNVAVEIVRSLDDHGDLPLRHDDKDELRLRNHNHGALPLRHDEDDLCR